MTHSINAHLSADVVTRSDMHTVRADTAFSRCESLSSDKLVSLSLLPSPPDSIQGKVRQLFIQNARQDVQDLDEREFMETECSPLLIDSGLLLISGDNRRHVRFNPYSVSAEPGTLGSLSIDEAGHWDYSVYNIKMQFLKLGQRKLERFSLRSEDGQAITITLTLIGIDGGAAIEELATEIRFS